MYLATSFYWEPCITRKAQFRVKNKSYTKQVQARDILLRLEYS
jgi:hypothetical protein